MNDSELIQAVRLIRHSTASRLFIRFPQPCHFHNLFYFLKSKYPTWEIYHIYSLDYQGQYDE